MWPFKRKPKIEQPAKAPELPEQVEKLARRRARSRSDRSDTVAAFLRRMESLQGGYDDEREPRGGFSG